MWRDATKAPDAAVALKITAGDLKELRVIDEVIPEPPGGAHRDHDKAASIVKEAIIRNLDELLKLPADELLMRRFEKFRKMGVFSEGQ